MYDFLFIVVYDGIVIQQTKMKIVVGVIALIMGGALLYYFYTNVRLQNVGTYLKPVSERKHEYEGMIKQVNANVSEKVAYSFLLQIDGGEMTPQIFFFDKDELMEIKVIDISGQEMTHMDLKVGQRVRVVQENKLAVKPYFRFTITLLPQ